jgi:hypothetical protein
MACQDLKGRVPKDMLTLMEFGPRERRGMAQENTNAGLVLAIRLRSNCSKGLALFVEKASLLVKVYPYYLGIFIKLIWHKIKYG